jgi:hypothetical protein
MEPTNQGEALKLSQVIQIDEGKIQESLAEWHRGAVDGDCSRSMFDTIMRTELISDLRRGHLTAGFAL